MKSKALINILFLFFFIGKLCAQAPPYYFSQVFGDPNRDELMAGIVKFNDNYLTISNNATMSSNWEFDCRILDENGVVLKMKNYSLPNKTLVIQNYKPIINKNDTSIYIVGRMAENNWHGMLWKLNKDLDTLWHKEYTCPIGDSSLQFASGVIVNDGIILYGISNQFDYYGDAFLMKVDFDGNEVWRNTQQIPNRLDRFTKVIKTKDNGFIAMRNIMYTNTDTDYNIIKYDSVFNYKWQINPFTPYADYEGDIVEANDSNYVICNGYTEQMLGGVMGTPKSKAILYKLDKNNGDVLWEKKYGAAINFNNIVKVQELTNGNLMAIGHRVTNFVGPKPTGAYVTYVLNVNSNGDSIKYQTVFSDSSITQNRLYDFCSINDNSYFFCGTSRNISFQYPDNWLIKCDSNICFETTCYTTSEIYELNKIPTKVFSLYPNPAQNNIAINFNAKNYDINMFDMLGNVVLEQNNNSYNTNVNISSLQNGSYLLQVKNGSNIVSRKIIIIKN